MITLHRYSNGEEVLIRTDPEPLVDEPAPGTVIVFEDGIAIQVTETVEQILRCIKDDRGEL